MGDEVVRAYGFLDDFVRRRWNMQSGMQDSWPQEGSREALADHLNFIVCLCLCLCACECVSVCVCGR